MRMRKKKNFAPRWERIEAWLVSDPEARQGQWRALYPKASELHVELGCGKGGFLTKCASNRPDALFLGLERVPEALLMAMEKAQADDLKNIRFICGDAAQISDYFVPGEADSLYLNFCDPWPSNKRANRRLTHRNFLVHYRRLLKPGCPLYFKTDNVPLFEFSLDELVAAGARIVFSTTDWHRDPARPIDDVMTEYETRFSNMGVPICRLEAVWDPETKPVIDSAVT